MVAPDPKSSRAFADYFELEVARFLSTALSLPFQHRNDLDSVRGALRQLYGEGASAVEAAQTGKARALAVELSGLANRRAGASGSPTAVRWVGRRGGVDVSTADIEIDHLAGPATAVSLKTTRRGCGTARNLGGDTIGRIVDLDLADIRSKMYEDVLTAIAADAPDRAEVLRPLGVDGRKSAMTPAEKQVAKRVGRSYTHRLAAEFARAWPTLDAEIAGEVIAMGTGQSGTVGDLYVAVATGRKVNVSKLTATPKSGRVTAHYNPQHPSQVKLMDGELLVLRIAFNCTNGLGLSSLCARCFTR